jgi:hypothetical protein
MNQCWAESSALYYLGQQWYADATNQFQGPSFGWNTPYKNAGSQLANGGYHCTGDAEYDTFDFKMIFHDLGPGNGFRVTVFQRVHKTTNPWNNAAMTWFQMFDAPKYQNVPEAAVDKTAVNPFVFVGNWEYAAGGGTVTWGGVAAVQGTPNEVWVDDDWVGSYEGQILSGHVFGYNAFGTIQEGINAVASGGTVNVAAGTYTQNVTIDKTVDLLGDSGAVLSGAGSGNGFLVKASNITINGFEIKSYQIGIRSYGGPSNFGDLDILNCFVHNNSPNGVLLAYDTFSTVTIDTCQINSNTQNGIGISNSATISNLNITNTTVLGNGHHGLFLAQANISTLNIQNSSFDNSTTTGYSGITFGTTASTIGDFSMQGGSLSGNKGCGLSIVQAPLTFNSITLDGVAVNNNSESGVMLGGNATPGTHTASLTIQNCVFQGNAWEHLDISGGWWGKFSVTGNTKIISNTFGSGPWAAIYIGDLAVFAATPEFHYNVFTLSNWGINSIYTGALDAENNWWGANNGPGGVGLGSGDYVSANVDYDPWLVLKISANPTDIVFGGAATSSITADMTTNSDDQDTSGSGHIPDDTQIIFTTDKGSIGSLTTTKATINGKATAALTSSETLETATVCAEAPHGAAVPEDQYKVCTGVNFVLGAIVVPGGPAVGFDVGGGVGGDISLPTTPTCPLTLTVNMLGKITTAKMTSDGVLCENCLALDPGKQNSWEAKEGTKLTLEGNKVPQLIKVTTAGSSPPSGPAETIGPTYEINAYASINSTIPSAITISPLFSMSSAYDPNELPKNVSEVLLSYYPNPNQGWLAMGSEGVVAEVGQARGTLNYFQPGTMLAKLAEIASPAKFQASNLTIRPSQAQLNQEVTISVNVANTGGASGDYNLELKVNGVVESTKQITLGAGANQIVSFTVAEGAIGKYQIEIASLTGEFVVARPPSINWWPIGGIIAAIILALAIWMLIRRRRFS